MLTALQQRRINDWTLLVCDRSALFSSLQRAQMGDWRWRRHLSLESLLAVTWKHIADQWTDAAARPSWRIDMECHPERWNCHQPIPEKGTAGLCEIAFDSTGLVGVDMKSHQTQPPRPYSIVVKGNEAQDTGCHRARSMPKPADVLIPSGSLFASLCVSGRLVTAPAREAVRAVLRQDATQQLKQRRVQGKLARMSEDIYLPGLQPRLFTNITPDPSWRHLCLPADVGIHAPVPAGNRRGMDRDATF